MPQTTTTPIQHKNINIAIGYGSSICAIIGDTAVKILVIKLQNPSAVAANRVGNTFPCDTYKMLKADAMPNLAIKMKTGNSQDS